MTTALLIFLGGGLGALARWLLSSRIETFAENSSLHRFPWGILACNLIGCFLIGTIFGLFSGRAHPSWVFPLAVTGFLGGFTTFSAFGNDTRILISEGFNLMALSNILISTIGGLAAVYLGYRILASTTS